MSTCFHIEEGALIFKRRYETVRIEGWGEHGLRVRSTENHTFTKENWALSENVPHTASVWTEDRMTRWNYTQHIAVIENGGVAEFGTYEELMEKKGIFYQMREMQL